MVRAGVNRSVRVNAMVATGVGLEVRTSLMVRRMVEPMVGRWFVQTNVEVNGWANCWGMSVPSPN